MSQTDFPTPAVEALAWLVWFARKSKGTRDDILDRALEQYPLLREFALTPAQPVAEAAADRMARALMAEWERVEGPIVGTSYHATFADLARVALAQPVAETTDLRAALEAHRPTLGGPPLVICCPENSCGWEPGRDGFKVTWAEHFLAALDAATPKSIDLSPTCNGGPDGACDDEYCRGHSIADDGMPPLDPLTKAHDKGWSEGFLAGRALYRESGAANPHLSSDDD